MRYFFHIFDGSAIHPDDIGSDLPSLDCAKRMANAVADELQKGGVLAQSSLVIVADADDNILFECRSLLERCALSPSGTVPGDGAVTRPHH